MITRITRVAQLLTVPESFVVELCEAGIVIIDGELEHVVERVRISWTMHHNMGVNLEGIEVALHLLAVIERDRRDMAGG